MEALLAQRGSAQEIYANEERDDVWAEGREMDLESFALDGLRSIDQDVTVDIECRRSSCRVRVQSAVARLTRAMGPYPFACQASYATPEFGEDEAGDAYVDIYLLFGEENLSPDAYRYNRDLTCPRYGEAFRASVAASTDR